MRVLVYKNQNSGSWIAQGVDFDIAAEAAGIHGAISSFQMAVDMQKQSDADDGIQELSTCGRPEPWVKEMYEQALPWEDGDENIRIVRST